MTAVTAVGCVHIVTALRPIPVAGLDRERQATAQSRRTGTPRHARELPRLHLGVQ
jgi:hypothetical protein